MAKIKHFNVGGQGDLSRLVGQPAEGHRRKLPAKVIRQFQERDDRKAMHDAYKPTAKCAVCGELHNIGFMRLHEGGWGREDEWWCLNCHHPIA